jgi:hypothetical protein
MHKHSSEHQSTPLLHGGRVAPAESDNTPLASHAAPKSSLLRAVSLVSEADELTNDPQRPPPSSPSAVSPIISPESVALLESRDTASQALETRVEDSQHREAQAPLSPITLGVLGLVLLGLAATILALLAYSERHNGLANAPQRLHYLWRFRPTASKSSIPVHWFSALNTYALPNSFHSPISLLVSCRFPSSSICPRAQGYGQVLAR